MSTIDSIVVESHDKHIEADLYQDGLLVRELDVVDSGGVDISKRDGVRRSARLTIIDEDGDLVPGAAGDILAPPSELRLRRGASAPDGTTATYDLGVFNLSVASVRETGNDLRIEVVAYDRARRVRRNRWTEPYVIAAGTNYATAIQELVDDRLPGLTYSFATTAHTTPLVVLGEEAQNDPWADAQKLAEAIGYELYFDSAGICTLQPEPDPDTGSPDLVLEDNEDATIVELSKKIDDEPGYNGVIVIGEGTGLDVPVRAEAWDDEPSSPSYYLGDCGRVPRIYRSPLIATQAQADDAAAALLRRELGVLEDVSFSAIANPRLDVSTVVRLVNTRALVEANYLIETLSMPLDGDIMTATTRARRIV